MERMIRCWWRSNASSSNMSCYDWVIKGNSIHLLSAVRLAAESTVDQNNLLTAAWCCEKVFGVFTWSSRSISTWWHVKIQRSPDVASCRAGKLADRFLTKSRVSDHLRFKQGQVCVHNVRLLKLVFLPRRENLDPVLWALGPTPACLF